jgi:hypothetical protein
VPQQVLESPELVDEQVPQKVLAVRLVSQLEAAAALEVLRPVVVAVQQQVSELVHEKQVRRKIHRIVLRLRSVFCKMNKPQVQLPHVAEVAAVQLMESAELVQVEELVRAVEQVSQLEVVAEALVSLLPVLPLHSLDVHSDSAQPYPLAFYSVQ